MEYYHEKVKTEAGIPARIYDSGHGRDKLRYPLHWHRNLEFDLVLEGSIRGRVGGQEQRAERGQIFFVNSGELHETEGSSRDPLRSVTMLLSDELLREYCPQLDSFYFIIEKNSSQEQALAALIGECARLQREKEEYYELELSILLRQICAVLLKECRHPKKEGASGGDKPWKNTKRIKRAISYMEENYQNGISIQEMGEVMKMTPAYFSRFFRNSTGQTFHSYLQRIRLCHAVSLLEAGERSVTEIALDSGFPNVKSFIVTFKKEYQTTPARYRRNERK